MMRIPVVLHGLVTGWLGGSALAYIVLERFLPTAISVVLFTLMLANALIHFFSTNNEGVL